MTEEDGVLIYAKFDHTTGIFWGAYDDGNLAMFDPRETKKPIRLFDVSPGWQRWSEGVLVLSGLPTRGLTSLARSGPMSLYAAALGAR